MAKKRILKAAKGFGDPDRAVREGIELLKRYLSDHREEKAAAKFQELRARYPDHPEVIRLGLLMADHLENPEEYLELAEKLIAVAPDDPSSYMELANAYLDNIYPFHALQTYQRALEKFTGESEREEFQKALEESEEIVDEVLEELKLERKDIPVALLHEQSQIHLARAEYPRAIETIERLLEIAPEFIPAYNNLGLAYRFQERIEEAIAASEKALELQPDNVPALANAVNYEVLRGQADRAKAHAEKLKAIPNDSNYDIYLKKAEAFSSLRDDRAMIELGEAAEQEEDIYLRPIFWHWLAVARANEGNPKKAREIWKEISHLQIVKNNLENLDLPADRQNSPWAFDVDRWLTEALLESMNSISAEKDDRKRESCGREYVKEHPTIIELARVILDRGDPIAKAFFISMAAATRVPELFAVLGDFALGDRGSLRERIEAGQMAVEAGLLPAGLTRMWANGEWREMLLIGMEITDKPSFPLAKKASRSLDAAILALREENGKEAESILTEALTIDPNSPNLQLRLAMAYRLQGRDLEAGEAIERIRQEYPEYAPASIVIAREAIGAGDLEAAKAILQSLLSRDRFHYQEFGQLCEAQIELTIAQKNKDAARSWLKLWRQIDPDTAEESPWIERLKERSLNVE
jgi:tetratricopeptide (TPR) repeat protein